MYSLLQDLKPENIGVNTQNWQLKIRDFGSVKVSDNDNMTPYMTDLRYRAPEIILQTEYNERVDVWSAGCIFGEMVDRRAIFSGENSDEQLVNIIALLGSPNNEFINSIPQYMQSRLEGRLNHRPLSWDELFPDHVFPQTMEPSHTGKIHYF